MTAVGHRALVAYERANGRYDLHYSHWGAQDWSLVTQITGNFPYGAPVEAVDGPPPIDPTPQATDRTFEDIVARDVDFRTYEALYRVSDSLAVAPFLVCWFGLPGTDDEESDAGAVVAIAADDVETDGAYVRGWFDGTKAVVLDAVERDHCQPPDARSYLATRVQQWSSDGREVRFGTGAKPREGSG